MPIVLMGKVYCKVDANYSLIEVGDFMTTSDTPGHEDRHLYVQLLDEGCRK